MSAAPFNGQYFDPPHNQYAQNSPDTFYGQVTVQPPTLSASDSANTPPSGPSHTSKSRRSVARPSHSQSQSQSTLSKQYSHVDSFDLTSSRGPSTQVRKERERQLANTPREALIQLTIKREYESKKAKQLLTTAVLQLEITKENLAREEEARKMLEEEKHLSSIKTTQAIINAQTESMNVQQEVGTYKLQAENWQRELKRVKEVVHAIEAERDEAERALVRSRTSARQMKEENVLLRAREEGRREGFEEGLRQGRITLDNGAVATEDQSTPKARKNSSQKHGSRKANHHTPPAPAAPTAASLEAEIAAAALRKIDENEKIRINKQLAAIAMELDAERQRSKDAERAAKRLTEERKKFEEDKKRLEEERERERRARKDAEKEREDIRRRDEARIKRLEEDRQRIQEAKDRELEELRRDKERLEKDQAAAVDLARKEVDLERERIKRLEEDRERDHERERIRDEREHEREKGKEKETSAAIAAAVTAAVGATKSSSSSYRQGSSSKSSPIELPHQRIPYLPMPAPPMVPGPGMPTPIVMPSAPGSGANGVGVPRATSSSSQRRYGRDRRMSVGSYSSLTSGLPLDMLQLGAGPARPMSRAGGAPPPTWMTNPPPDFTRGEMESWRSNVGSGVSDPYGSQAPISMPRAPGDGPDYTGPISMPRAPGDGLAYQAPPITMPRAPMDDVAFTPLAQGSAGYQTPSANYQGAPVSMPRAPGEAPSSYQPPVTMPTAPGEAPASYRPPITMPVAPGEGPSTYKPPVTMPTAPGEGPATYKPPMTMPTAPGEGPATYKPPITMPTAPGEGPSTYKPPASMSYSPGEGAAYQPPPSMPRAPGEGPAYHPPPVIPPAPGESGYQTPITMPRAPADGPGYTPPVAMPMAPGEGPGYRPPITMPRAPADGSDYRQPVTMPRAPADGGRYDPPITMPRAPADGPGPAYTPRSHTRSISMPQAPGDGPGYIPPSTMSHRPGAAGNMSPIAMPRAPSDGLGYTSRSHTPSISMPRAPGDAAVNEPPVIPRPLSSAGHRGYSNVGGDYASNNGLLSPHASTRNRPMRRPSNGSTGSYEILIEPPSRPSSLIGEPHDQDIHSYLSPNHQPVVLPQPHPVVLPTRPRNRRHDSRGTDREPSSPVEAPFGLPPNFIPQTLTDRNGVSTPISHPSVLPGMGRPVIPRPPSSQGMYGNPLANRDRDRDSPPTMSNKSPFIPPAVLSGAGMSSPNMGGWGVPSRAGSLGGGPSMTPGSTTRDLPGQRPAVSIYGPPAGSGGFSPNVRNNPMVMPMPMPNVRGGGEDEDDDGFDSTTLNNTRMNTNVLPPPAEAPKKKKKGKR